MKRTTTNCDLGPWTCAEGRLARQAGLGELLHKVHRCLRCARCKHMGHHHSERARSDDWKHYYEGMHYTPETEKAFLKDYLGPAMQAKQSDTKIFIYDHNKDHIVTWADATSETLRRRSMSTGLHFIGIQAHTLKILPRSTPSTPISNCCRQSLPWQSRTLERTTSQNGTRASTTGLKS